MQTKEWYKSEKGKEEYIKADNIVKKTEYYYNYLLTLSPINDHKQLLKLAYIMADAVDGSSLDYSSWPDIIDENKNPLLKVVSEGKLLDVFSAIESDDITLGLKKEINKHRDIIVNYPADVLLCAFNSKSPHCIKIEELQQPGSESFDQDRFLVEREIIQFFCFKSDDPYETGIYNRYGDNDDQPFFDSMGKTYDLLIRQTMDKTQSEIALQEQEKKKKKRRIVVLVVIIALIVAFFGGKAVVNAQKAKRQAEIEQENRIKYSSQQIEIAVKNKESRALTMGGYNIDFPMTLYNNSRVGISGIQGEMIICDYDGKELVTVNTSFPHAITSMSSIDTTLQVNASAGPNTDLIHSLSFDELTIHYIIQTIKFSDGHTESNLSDRRTIHTGIKKSEKPNIEHINPNNNTADNNGIIGYATVIIDDLNIRNTPGTNGKILTLAKQWQSYPVYETTKSGGYTWYRIGTDMWIADDNGEYLTFSTDGSELPNSVFFGRWLLFAKENGHYQVVDSSSLTLEKDGNWIKAGGESAIGGEWKYAGGNTLILLQDWDGDGKADQTHTVKLFSVPDREYALDDANNLPEYYPEDMPLCVLYYDGEIRYYVK